MTAQAGNSQLHHVVFAVAPEQHDAVVGLFTATGFTLQDIHLAELGLHIHLDWERGVELISPAPDAQTPVAQSVRDFLTSRGNGVYTVVVKVPDASAAESIAKRYGGATRFEQHMAGDGTYLDEIDMSVLGLPLTFLGTNMP